MCCWVEQELARNGSNKHQLQSSLWMCCWVEQELAPTVAVSINSRFAVTVLLGRADVVWGFVSGHDFSRAVTGPKKWGL
jgi:hypothetical protein